MALAADMPNFDDLLESAAVVQEIVPDAVLVGGTAAAVHAGHRLSMDHDHVVTDLRDRFEIILNALEREGERVTNRVQAGKIVLGDPRWWQWSAVTDVCRDVARTMMEEEA